MRNSQIIEEDSYRRIGCGIEDGKFYVKSVFQDDDALRRVKKLRDSELLNRAKVGIHDDADMLFSFSCPDTQQWQRFKRLHPEVYAGLHDSSEEVRRKAGTQLSLIHPEWVVQSRGTK